MSIFALRRIKNSPREGNIILSEDISMADAWHWERRLMWKLDGV